jgi:hypothetical protein
LDKFKEFDLNQFKTRQEVEYLIQDYPVFNTLAQISIVIGYLQVSKDALKLTNEA